ncbi:MAG: glycosyltransferase [Gammaproteobacteria bacterium]|nr:glycosyltransferase [Gammaproteobacteria bacterium]MBU1416720.1 glycosyltransferase [Gammaproteobacteria bacterium]
MHARIAYLINQYPKVSHSFIRREILALERQGIDVLRIALRGWDAALADEEDKQERTKTRYVLQGGLFPLLLASLKALIGTPRRFFAAFALAIRLGWKADRPLLYHMMYLAEACHLVPWITSFKATHLHAHFGTNSAEVAALASALGGFSYSFTVHGPDEFDSPELLHIREKVKRAAFVVGISSFGRSQLYRWIDYNDWPKIQVVHCGLEARFYEGAASVIPQTRRLVCVGRLCKAKGQLLLLDAMSRALRNGGDFELVLAGDGELRPEVDSAIQRLSLQGKVRVTGWISSQQVRDEILASQALILPTFAEGLPVVIMEAMALRRPILTTYVAGIPELVRPGIDGWLSRAGDIDALVSVLEEYLSTSVDELARMGESAHQRVVQRHSIDTEAAKLAKLFREAPQLQ